METALVKAEFAVCNREHPIDKTDQRVVVIQKNDIPSSFEHVLCTFVLKRKTALFTFCRQ